MSNRFSDLPPIPDGSVAAVEPRRTGRFDDLPPTVPDIPVNQRPVPTEPWYYRAAKKADDVVRAAVDTGTFGLFDRALEATGAEPGARQRSAEARARSPYLSVAGDVAGSVPMAMGAAAGLARAAPRVFAGAGIPQMAASGAVTGMGMTGADDVIRGNFDPTMTPAKVALSGALGGAAGAAVGVGARVLSPDSRVRGFGAGITEPERSAAQRVAGESQAAGVPLSVPEILNAASPQSRTTARVLSRYEDTRNSAAGSEAVRAFEAGRQPVVQRVRESLAGMVGPDVSAARAAENARAAIEAPRLRMQEVAGPLYQQGVQTPLRLSPQALAAEGASNADRAAIRQAATTVRSDPVRRGAIADELGIKPSDVRPNTVAFADAIKKELDAIYTSTNNRFGAGTARPYRGAGDRVTEIADRASPSYAMGRQASELGKRTAEAREQGPLGRIASNPGSTQAQAEALFGVTNAQESNLARRAVAALDEDVARGILSNRMQTSAARGSDPLPTQASRDVARKVMGDAGFGPVEQTLDALSRVRSGVREPNPIDYAGSLPSRIYRAATNFGRGDVAELLNNPATISILGRRGPKEDAGMGVATAFTNEALLGLFDRNERRRRRRQSEN